MRTILKLKNLIPVGISAFILAAAMFATVQAAYPTFWTQWVVANASITPSPQPTGFAGPVAVAQATAAPTQQPYRVDVLGIISNAATTYAAQSGTNGPVVVAQATAAPTEQPGNVYAQLFLGDAATTFAALTGTKGEAVIAQATAAPTAQPGSIDVIGKIIAGGTYASGCANGDGCFARGVSSGAINLGGATTSSTIDFGVNTANLFSIYAGTNFLGGTSPVQIGGSPTAASFNMFASASNSGVQPASSSQPYTVYNAAGSSINVQADDSGGLSGRESGVATTTHYAPVYTSGGATIASTLHETLSNGDGLTSVSCAQIGTTGIYNCSGTLTITTTTFPTQSVCYGLVTGGSVAVPGAGIRAGTSTVTINWTIAGSPASGNFYGTCQGR